MHRERCNTIRCCAVESVLRGQSEQTDAILGALCLVVAKRVGFVSALEVFLMDVLSQRHHTNFSSQIL